MRRTGGASHRLHRCHSGCDAINKQVADWGDYSGPLGEHALGITVMNHPANLPILFRYRVVVHDGDRSAVDLPRL